MPTIIKYQPPPIVTGYPLNNKISLVVPLNANVTNLVTNPSCETNLTGWTAVGATISRVSTKQRRGIYCLQIAPTSAVSDGAYYSDAVNLLSTNNTVYSVSFDFWGAPGVPYTALVTTTGAVTLKSVTLRGKGYWERIFFLYDEITATAARRFYVQKNNSASTANFYVDGFMIAAQPYELKYFDGDTVGYTSGRQEFYWSGTAHGSTSIMTAQTRSGGKLVSLAEYGFVLLALLGMGMQPVDNLAQRMTLTGGALFQRTVKQVRGFDLVGYISGDNRSQVERSLAKLIYDLDSSRVPYSQPIVLQYQALDDCNNPTGATVDIPCLYSGGLGGNVDNNYRVNLDVKFELFLPYAATMDGSEGTAINSRTTITNANYIIYRKPDGTWKAASTGLSARVNAIIRMPDGRFLIGGDFLNAGGDANADCLAYYNPVTDTFSAAVTASLLTGTVYALLLLPTGKVLVGGDFPNGGANRPQYLRILDPSTNLFVDMVNIFNPNNIVYALELLPTGFAAVGGLFTDADSGSGNGDYLSKFNYTTAPYAYEAFNTTPLNSYVTNLEIGLNGQLWIGGNFTNVNGVASQDYLTMLGGPNDFSVYTTFYTIGGSTSPLNNAVTGLLSRSDGSLLVGTSATNIDGDTTFDKLFASGPMLNSLSSADVSFSRLKLFENINGAVGSMAEIAPSVILVGGDFTSVNNIALFDRLFQFSGNTLRPLDLDLPGSAFVSAVYGNLSGEILIGFNTAGTAYTSGTTTVTNSGSTDAFPIIVISYGAAATVLAPVYSIRNLTSGQIISFSLSLLPGETITLDFRPGKKTITSSIRNSLVGSVLPGSNLSTFRLLPGPNVLNLLTDIAAAANITASAFWVPAYTGLESTVR